MFKKLYGKINGIFAKLDTIQKEMSFWFDGSCDSAKSIKELIRNMPTKPMEQTIASQQRTIEQLTNALKDKYEHGLFIFSEDCKIPMVIRNGKELTNELTTHFGIEWNRDEAPLINIEQAVGTIADSER